MKYTVRKSVVNVVGQIWMPNTTCAQSITLSGYDVGNVVARKDDETTWRDAVEDWLTCNAGDFQSITDFSASLEVGDGTIDLPWKDEESEFTFNDCLFPGED